MKFVKLLLTAFLCSFLMSGPVNGATVLTDAQIGEMSALAQAGGDVGQAAQNMLEGVTADLIAQGLTGDELSTQVSIAIQELGSGLDAGSPDFEVAIASLIEGGTAGAIVGVNQAVGADPNLDAGALTSSVTNGAANAVGVITAANPGLNSARLQTAVNQGAQSQGAPPVAPEAFEPAATPPDDSTLPPLPPSETPPPAPPEVVETPPTGDEAPAGATGTGAGAGAGAGSGGGGGTGSPSGRAPVS